VPAVRQLAGRYQLEVPLGRGTFGEVWRARDVTTRRSVAVKIVELGEIPDAQFLAELVARFRRETITAGLGALAWWPAGSLMSLMTKRPRG
jgi:serine/threonine protein kinase